MVGLLISYRRLTPGSVVLVVLLLILNVSKVWAISPGPLSDAHSYIDSIADCNSCHTAGYGVPDNKCLSCHVHQALRSRIEAGLGFHSSKKVKGKRCFSCHEEHLETYPGSGKGRRSSIDWRLVGGRKRFDHDLTGWPLEGKHRKQDCEKCHTNSYSVTKLPSYLGQRNECTTCHFGEVVAEGAVRSSATGVGGGNPHKFVDASMTNCLACHSFEGFEILYPSDILFDHDRTAYPLKGLHTQNRCTECHKSLDDFRKVNDFASCSGCHEDSHRSIISKERTCSSCHSPITKFEETVFDHGLETGWPHRGQHQKLRCNNCHEVDSTTKAPEPICISCHKDIHNGRFESLTCESCHVENGFETITFDHRRTKFTLTGKHQDIMCQDCHRFGIGRSYEKLQTGCANCHEHKNAHCGQFGEVNCEICHVQGGDLRSQFDHALTRLPLEEGHQTVDCERCHRPVSLGPGLACQNTIKYTGLRAYCSECHVDVHNQSLGDNCAKCHSSGTPFDIVSFDHNRDSDFPIVGFHEEVACETCHPQRAFKLKESRCVSCHQDDDAHQQALGDDCGLCHDPTGGSDKFDHSSHTEFSLEGTHARIACESCHSQCLTTASKRGELSTKISESFGLGNGAGSPSDVTAIVCEEPGTLDLRFRRVGDECQECHPDPHQVQQQGIDCGQCHNSEIWPNPPKNGYHETLGFSFSGAHRVVGCQLCHEGTGTLTGRGERCMGCHVQDDIHAGSLGADCGRCHNQNYWFPSTFSHTDVGFILQGVHRSLDCRSCHQTGNYFIGSECITCHLSDYRSGHGGNIQQDGNIARINGSSDCGRCHTQFSFSGALFVPR